jgi:CxxC motif-containing protein
MMKPQRYEANKGSGEISRRIVCKSCTAKCRMVYEPQSGKLTGNKCPRGEAFAKAYSPEAVKVRTYLVPVENGYMKRMALRTDEPIGERLSEIVEAALKPVVVTAPVEAGATVFRNVGGSGVDLIATRKMPARVNGNTP